MLTNQYGSYETWMAALASSACIGFTSLVPWLFNLTFFEHKQRREEPKQDDQATDGRMKFLLSFAAGAILGDIFFHLIPESQQSYQAELHVGYESAARKVGLAIIAGLFMFFIVEMMLEQWSTSMQVENVQNHANSVAEKNSTKLGSPVCDKSFHDNQELPTSKKLDLNNCFNGLHTMDDYSQDITNNNNDLTITNRNTTPTNPIMPKREDPSTKGSHDKAKSHIKPPRGSTILEKYSNGSDSKPKIVYNQTTINVAGYLSLIANGLDNFTHGLAIGASFLAGPKVGLLTTFVIFIHEIPHEICDYAILVNSGFSRLEAVKAQSSVSLFGILGTATALYVKSVNTLTAQTLWILPFSAGGFLYIALVNLLPQILDHKDDQGSTLLQILGVILGLFFMAAVAIL